MLPVSTGPTFPRWGRFSHPREVGTLSVSVFPPRSQIPQFRTRKILRTRVRGRSPGLKTAEGCEVQAWGCLPRGESRVSPAPLKVPRVRGSSPHLGRSCRPR